MDYLNYNGEKIPYRIEKANRKTISIRVNGDGIIVRAPKSLSNGKIMELLEKKKHWIVVKYREMKDTKPLTPNKTYAEGCPFLYRGNIVTLRYVENRPSDEKIWLENSYIYIIMEGQSIETVKLQLEQWYRCKARERIQERVDYYTRHYDFGKTVNRIFIKDQKSRWGSCSSKSNLNFNYRLIMAEDYVLDYVVVHELCHLKYMNHSAMFWSAVESILPQYKDAKEWLRKNGRSLYV